MKGSNLGVAVVALAIGVGIGVFVGRGASSDPCLTASDHILDVGLDSSVSCFKAKIKRNTTHRVHWESPEGTTLTVRFPSSVPQSVPQPVCRAGSNRCVLGPLPATVPPSDSNGYPYDVTVTGGSAAASTAYATSPTPTPPQPKGRIIIKK